MHRYEREFEARPFWTGGKLLLLAMLTLMGVGAVGCFIKTASAPITGAAGVVQRIFDPDKMLSEYQWFHDAAASLDLYPNKIKLAVQAVKVAGERFPERESARMTELTGLQQVCLGLVGQYNSRAVRLDAGLFKNPEKFLPFSAEGWTPLPVSYAPNWCDAPAE